MSDEVQDVAPVPAQARPSVAAGGIQGMVGSSAGGAGVLGLFLALQSAGLIPSLESEGKRAETHIKDVLDSEFGFLVQACFDDYALKRRKKRKRTRTRVDDEDEDEGDE